MRRFDDCKDAACRVFFILLGMTGFLDQPSRLSCLEFLATFGLTRCVLLFEISQLLRLGISFKNLRFHVKNLHFSLSKNYKSKKNSHINSCMKKKISLQANV